MLKLNSIKKTTGGYTLYAETKDKKQITMVGMCKNKLLQQFYSLSHRILIKDMQSLMSDN